MSRSRLTVLAVRLFAFVLLATATFTAARADAVILDFRTDPMDPAREPVLALQGPGADQFVFDPSTSPAFPSDAPGSLLARYDSTRGTTRAVASLGNSFTEADDFVFGAIVMIREDAFEADPFGFHPITFSLINAATTGFNRTGSLTDFRSDTFDTIDVAWFPQVSPFFGGPFLAPAVFGSAVGDDAFANFAFGSTQFEIPRDVPHLVTAEHDAAGRKLVVTVYALGRGGRPVAIPGGSVEMSLASLAGFSVDALAVTAYEDGFNIFTQSGRSVRADVDYDLIFFAPGRLGEEGTLPSLMSLIRRGAEGAKGVAEP